MTRFALSLLLALGLAGTAYAGGNDDLDIDKVNGSIHVPDNATVGKLSTVNGSVHVGTNAHAKSGETVNGGIDVESGATLDSLETVNGGIHIGEKVRIAKTVETVNGSITLGNGADVAGHTSNVNGGIRLESAHVGGGIETVSGDITIGANSHVEGGVLVDEDHSWFHMGSVHKPRIVIGPHAVVQGKMTFKREVDLYVSDSATIGAIEGATPTKFSGDQAPQ
jgi:acetyltransferase-like isoleucine patch superfamily enzyme